MVSACCSISDDLDHARRRVAGLVGFYGSVRTYLTSSTSTGSQRTSSGSSTPSGRAPARTTSPTRSPTGWSTHLPSWASRDEVAARIEAYDGLADCLKLSPPTHGLAAQDTREAQDEIIALMGELTGARG